VHRIGRTARLGAEGDAISFACERYAMSLPDIERFIEQKIPSEPVTRDLMTALPRTPRAAVAAEPGEEGEESVSAIFREAREQRAADDARRGSPRSRGPGAGAGRAVRSDSRRDGAPRRERPRTGESVASGAEAAASRPPRKPRDVAAPAQDNKPVAAAAAVVEGERAPRKRRRRRGGMRIEGEAAGGSAPSRELPTPASRVPALRQASTPPPAASSSETKPSLLSRLGRGLKSLVTRSPSNQH
jgi:ATP-dependent RNA helicase RhlB